MMLRRTITYPHFKMTIDGSLVWDTAWTEDETMRVVFSIEIKVDIPAHDDKRREALIELLSRASRTLRTQCSMVSRGIPPTIKASVNDADVGEVEIPLFEEQER
jgi:hypothetical protein